MARPLPARARPAERGAAGFGLAASTAAGGPPPVAAVSQQEVEQGARSLLQALNQARLPETPSASPDGREHPGLAAYRAVQKLAMEP